MMVEKQSSPPRDRYPVPDCAIATMTTHSESNVLSRIASIFLIVPVILLIIPFAVMMFFGMVIYGVSLAAIVWITWCSRGIDTLVVYSNSPNWHDYMVDKIIPRLEGRAIIINWSERQHWKRNSLPVAVFRFFGGDREFNPMVIVIQPFKVPRTFRFWQPFRDRKHGNISSLHEVENRLYTCLDINPPQTGG